MRELNPGDENAWVRSLIESCRDPNPKSEGAAVNSGFQQVLPITMKSAVSFQYYIVQASHLPSCLKAHAVMQI